jgi:outer membrane protein assembly factor BamB
LKITRTIGLVALSSVVTACSLGKVKETIEDLQGKNPEPHEKLSYYFEKARVDKIWATSLGNGQGGDNTRIQHVVDESRVYVAAQNGQVAAFDRKSGKRIWRQKLGFELTSGVGFDVGRLYVGSANGDLIALSAKDGKQLWRQPVQGVAASQPGAYGGLVAVQTVDDRLVVVDGESGKKLWEYRGMPARLSMRGASTPIINESVVVAGFSDGWLKGFRLEDGMQVWEVRLGVPRGTSEIDRMVDVDARMVQVENRVFAAGMNGRLVSVDMLSGEVFWSRPVSSWSGISEGWGNVFLTDADGNVHAFDMYSGKTVWRNTDTSFRKLTQPLVFGEWLLFTDYQGYLHVLDQDQGKTVGRYQLKEMLIDVASLNLGGIFCDGFPGQSGQLGGHALHLP